MNVIVKINDKGYSLIDEKVRFLNKEYYYRIKYIGSSYYAVYTRLEHLVLLMVQEVLS